MKHITFEEYLEGYHADNINEGSTSGDMLQEAYEKWVTDLEPQEVMELAERYGLYLTNK